MEIPLKPESKAAAKGEKPFYRPDIYRFMTSRIRGMNVIPVVIRYVVMKSRHQLQVKTPDAQVDIETCIK